MFENLFNKKISTENLFVASLKICVEKEFIMGRHILEDGYLNKFQVVKHFLFVRKVKKDYNVCYQTIFTKTIYEQDPSCFEIGNIYINNIAPFPATTPYIMYEEAVNMYKKINNMSSNQDSEVTAEIKQDSNKTLQKRRKH